MSLTQSKSHPFKATHWGWSFHWAISQTSMSKTDKVSWADAFLVQESKPASAWPLFNRMRWSGNHTGKMCSRKPPHHLISHVPILSKSSNEHVRLGFKRRLSLTPKTPVMISDPPFIFLCMAIFRLCKLKHRSQHLCDLRFPSDQTQWSLPVPRSVILGKPGAPHVVS